MTVYAELLCDGGAAAGMDADNVFVYLRSMSPLKRRGELMTSGRKRRAAKRTTDAVRDNFPRGIARPVPRARVGAGLTRLEDLQRVTRDDLAELHGMGPRALQILGRALNESGRRFRDEDGGA